MTIPTPFAPPTARYEWREGRAYRIDADVVASVIEDVERQEGACSAEQLVKTAKPKTSKIHDLFEWDDTIAGAAYRVGQARRIISSLRVVDHRSATLPRPPAFMTIGRVALPKKEDEADEANETDEEEEDTPGYVSMTSIRDDPARRSAYVRAELRQIRGWLERTAWIEEFAPLRRAIPAVDALVYGTDIGKQAAD